MIKNTAAINPKETPRHESKPEKLAKILYRGIERYIRAENARNREKNCGWEVDFSRKRRVNVIGSNID
jgi:hypothetical protein